MTLRDNSNTYKDKQIASLSEWAGVDIGDMEPTEQKQFILNTFKWTGEVRDLGVMVGKCEMCGHRIRYEYMLVTNSEGPWIVGSDCIVTYIDASIKGDLSAARPKVRLARLHRELVSDVLEVVPIGDELRDWVDSQAKRCEQYGTLFPSAVEALDRVMKYRTGVIYDTATE